MRRPEAVRQIDAASERVSVEIDRCAQGGFYARAMATEGYAGGYRDALSDVLLLLTGVIPHRRTYCSTPTEGDKK